MRMRRFAAPAAPLAAALLMFVPLDVSAKGHSKGNPSNPAHIRPTSQPQGFWYGHEVPTGVPAAGGFGSGMIGFEAEFIHSALVNPDANGWSPIRALMNRLEWENLNPERARGLQKADVTKAQPGYTLLSSLFAGPILVDIHGQRVTTPRWTVNSFPAKLLPGGSILGYGRPPPGQESGRPGYGDNSSLVQQSWCGQVEWSFSKPPPGDNPEWGARVHHDFEREGNPVGYYVPGMDPELDGTTARNWLLVHREPDPQMTRALFGENSLPLEDDSIIEVENGEITWVWNAWEHLDQFGFDPVALEAIRTIRVSTFAGAGGGGGGPPETDWQHVNQLSQLGPNRHYDAGDERFHPDNIILDGRSTNIIWIVARHDDPQGRWLSGDIVWKTGPDYANGKENRIGQIIGQHTAHMIPKGLPGEGNILVYDNGGLAGYGSLLPGLPPFWPVTFRSYSRVVEFDPITYDKVWEYTNETDRRSEGGDRRFFSWFISSVQRLENGNTLITEGNDGRVFEVTPEGEIVWEYYEPFGVGFVYRAYRYPESYLPADPSCP